MKTYLEKLFVIIAFLILIVTIYTFMLPENEHTYHFMLTGMNRARFYASQAKFKPYNGKTMGGYAALATAVKNAKEKFKDDPYYFLSIGTEISGSADAYFTKGEAVIKEMNELGLNAMLLSNIDFSFGWQQLENLRSKASFPFIGTNIKNKSDNSTPSWLLSEYILPEKGKLKIGVIGIAPTYTPNLTSIENITGLDFNNPETHIKNSMEKLKKSGADLIILLTQYNKDYITKEEWDIVAKSKPDVCIMLDQELEPPTPYIRDGVLVYSINSYNQTKELDVLDIQLETHPIKITGIASRRIPIDLAAITQDKEMETTIEQATSEFRAKRNTVIGEFDKDYAKAYMEECPIGDMVTDAIKKATNAQAVLQNSGGIQNSINGGSFTIDDLYSMLPFANTIKVIKLKGSDLLEALTLAASKQRGVLQVSGIEYSFEHKSSKEYKLLYAKLDNGTDILPESEYLVAINNFLYEGGDNFISFKKGTLVSEEKSIREIVADYIKAESASAPIHLKTYKRITIEE